jgi:hypothetical protein
MKQIIVTTLFLASSIFLWALDPPSSGYSSKSNSNRRKFGVGINYTYPAPGLSAKVQLSEKLKGQFSVFRRSYDFSGYSYSWSMYGAELDYCFKESTVKKGAVSPFVFGGLGRGLINMSDFGTDNTNWWAYQVGAGIEWFPLFLDGNLGITWKLGYGNVGASTGFGDVSVNGVLLYGFALHYYIK